MLFLLTIHLRFSKLPVFFQERGEINILFCRPLVLVVWGSAVSYLPLEPSVLVHTEEQDTTRSRLDGGAELSPTLSLSEFLRYLYLEFIKDSSVLGLTQA